MSHQAPSNWVSVACLGDGRCGSCVRWSPGPRVAKHSRTALPAGGELTGQPVAQPNRGQPLCTAASRRGRTQSHRACDATPRPSRETKSRSRKQPSHFLGIQQSPPHSRRPLSSTLLDRRRPCRARARLDVRRGSEGHPRSLPGEGLPEHPRSRCGRFTCLAARAPVH